MFSFSQFMPEVERLVSFTELWRWVRVSVDEETKNFRWFSTHEKFTVRYVHIEFFVIQQLKKQHY